MQRLRWYGPSLILLLTVLGVMLVGPKLIQDLAHAQNSSNIRLAQNELTQSPFLSELSQSFRKVAEVVEPSVVSISVARRVDNARSSRGNNPFDGTPWERFFKQRPDQPEGQNPGDSLDQYNVPRAFGNGSGWVYDETGHIVTNNHVVAGAETITVLFADGTETRARIVGTDPSTDIAVLKIDTPHLHPASLAVEPAAKGDIVFAFGSPFRYDFSMSMGIVSAKGRQLGIIGDQTEDGRFFAGFENFIQTDAAINPGNSGGPLTNIYGQVIGMNTAIATRTRSYNGLGFAIPTDMIVNVVDQIIEEGEVARGFLGIRLPAADLTPEMAKSFGFDGRGVLVADAIDGSPAEQAGLQAGDIVTHIDDQPIQTIRQLRFAVASMRPGTTIDVTYYRQGQGINTAQVTLGRLAVGQGSERPSDQPDAEQNMDDAADEGKKTLAKLGFTSLSTLTESAAERMDREHTPGVLIRSIRRGSVAASEGIRPGLVITHIMGEEVDSVDALAEAVTQHDATEGLRMRVAVWDAQASQYSSSFVFVKLPD